MKRDAFSQLSERLPDRAVGQRSASFGNEKVFGQGKKILPALRVGSQWLDRASMQGNQTGFAVLAFPNDEQLLAVS